MTQTPEEISTILGNVVTRKGLLEHKTSASFDGIHREPVDSLAAIVTSRGIQVEIVGKFTRPIFETQPPTINPIRLKDIVLTSENLTGRKRGRLTVVGFSRDIAKRWVVRCACGLFEFRTAKAVKNRKNNQDACEVCRKIFQAKRSHDFRSNQSVACPPTEVCNTVKTSSKK